MVGLNGGKSQREGKRRVADLRHLRDHTLARLRGDEHVDVHVLVYAHTLRQGQVVVVARGGVIPGDGEVIEGAGMVDESLITGDETPVSRGASGEERNVTGGTRLVSGELTVRTTADAGATVLDHIIREANGRPSLLARVGRWGTIEA